MPQTNEPSQIKSILDELSLGSSQLSMPPSETLENSRERVNVNKFCRFFRLEELLYDGEKPTREAWQNFISAIHVTGMNFIYIVRGDEKGTHIYLGLSTKPDTLEAQQLGDYARDILESSFQGMFRGSKLKTLIESETESEIFEPLRKNCYLNVVTGIPTLQNEKKKNPQNDYQGMDRLISAMHGENWQMVIVCEPISRENVTEMREQAYEIFDTLSLLAKNSLQSSHSSGHSDSRGTSSGQSHSTSENFNSGKTETTGTNKSSSYSENVSVSQTTTSGESVTISHTEGKSTSHGRSENESHGSQQSVGQSSGTSKSKSANRSSSHGYSGDSDSHGTSDSSSQQTGTSSSKSTSTGKTQGQSFTEGKSQSETQGKSRNTSTADVQGKSRTNQQSDGTSQSVGQSETHGTGRSETQSTGKNFGQSDTTGQSLTASVDVVNKKAAEFLKYIDETLLPRLSVGNNRGMFKTAVYLLTQTKSINARLCNNVAAIFQGESTSFTPLMIGKTLSNVNWIDDLQIHSANVGREISYGSVYGLPVHGNRCDLATFLTGDEVGILAGLPLTEVPGIALRRYIPFGLNPSVPAKKFSQDILPLGRLVYGGEILQSNEVSLNKNCLNKHIFVTGITGSGKTVTCKRLLRSANMPFLVIEPAKTEYQELLCDEGMDDVIVFTLGTEKGLPLRFNPFELLPEENLTAHIDMVKAAFMSSFQFEASMPQIFEMAMYRAYQKCGWNTDSGEYEGTGEKKWPTLTTFIKRLEEVVKEQKFGPELEGNYRGSLISRIANLTCGAKGTMLDCSRSIDFRYLLRSKVVIEMEDLKSPQDKALIMALIIGRLSEAVKEAWRENNEFCHITLIEEAHRLLSKVMPGDDEGKKFSVSMFADMLAEIRKYGESLIIVDQIPNKLTEDVLKNTATKIVHKLVAKDDKEVIGDTMMLEDEQKTFLSNLTTGRAIVFTENWNKPVCVQVDDISAPINYADLNQRLTDMEERTKWENLYAYYPELPIQISREDYKKYVTIGRKSLNILRKLFGEWIKLSNREKEKLFNQLPPNFCDTADDAGILLSVLTNANQKIDLKGFEGLYIGAILFAGIADFATFSKKYSEDIGYLANYL